MRHTGTILLPLVAAASWTGADLCAEPIGTAITYQGQLKQGGVPVDGQANIVFILYDAETGGAFVDDVAVPLVEVADGLFSVQLDFDAGVFDGSALWLEVIVEHPPGEQNWTTLSPRQPITPVPYALYSASGSSGGSEHWAANGADIHNTNAGNVGIGTTTPNAQLHVTSDASRTARFTNDSSSGGIAVVASASGNSGSSTAVDAYTASPTGAGVSSFNEAESGNAYALKGDTASAGGIAVYGRAANSQEHSTGIGVYGRSDSDDGAGVYGEATHADGTAFGVRGVVTRGGTAVQGENQSVGSIGALGRYLEGVYGQSSLATSGIGVHGKWTGSSPGWGFGGAFTTTSELGAGVLGRNEAVQPGGIGVIGVHVHTTGAGYGVRGETASSIGHGVHGYASSSSGVNYGVYGETESADGYAGYFLGGRNYFDGRVGIGTTDPAEKVHVSGGDIRADGDIQFYQDGELALECQTTTWGKQCRFLNTSTGNRPLSFGVSLGDGGGFLTLRDENGRDTLKINADSDHMQNGIAEGSVWIRSVGGGAGGELAIENDDGELRIQALGGASGEGGTLQMFNGAGTDTIMFDGGHGSWTGGRIDMFAGNSLQTVEIDSDHDYAGEIALWDNSRTRTLRVLGRVLTLYDSSGTETISLNGDTGTKSGVVTTSDFGRRLLYAVESPEVWFEDFGSAQLADGQARVDLDPIFIQTVTINEQHPMKVFVTLTDECNGVFVEKGTDHFVVRELGGGRSSATFDWRIVAKRRGQENTRLKTFTPPEELRARAELTDRHEDKGRNLRGRSSRMIACERRGHEETKAAVLTRLECDQPEREPCQIGSIGEARR